MAPLPQTTPGEREANGVLAENAHPLNEEPIGISSPLGLLPECEELVSVSAEKAGPL